jgi:hypothetical protein
VKLHIDGSRNKIQKFLSQVEVNLTTGNQLSVMMVKILVGNLIIYNGGKLSEF